MVAKSSRQVLGIEKHLGGRMGSTHMVGTWEVSWRGKSRLAPSFLATVSERRAMQSVGQEVVLGEGDDLFWSLPKAELEARIWM